MRSRASKPDTEIGVVCSIFRLLDSLPPDQQKRVLRMTAAYFDIEVRL